jgi:OmcA/MtrC family decaheme c-type cytochrome
MAPRPPPRFRRCPTPPVAGRNGYAAIFMIEADDAGLNVGGNVVKPNTAVATLTLGTNVAAEGGLPNNRRKIVSVESCNSCHTTTFRHGTFANADITGCVTCHNAGSLSRDASEIQGTVDLMFMVHAIHGLGDGKREAFERRRAMDAGGYSYVTNPNTVLDCKSCHLPGTYAFPIDGSKRLGVIADGQKDSYLTGTGVNSAEASVCFSCHESGVDLDADPVKAHMVTFGATMDGTGSHASLRGEISACTACHTPAN